MAQSRGELLYTTHCVACHTTAMHWRDKRSVKDWASLKLQVRRWQDAASLAWSESDILEVSRYLNDTVYHFQQIAAPDSSRCESAVPQVCEEANLPVSGESFTSWLWKR